MRLNKIPTNLNLKTFYSEGVTLSTEPLIHIVDSFITDEEIINIMGCGASTLTEAAVLSPNVEKGASVGVKSTHRTGKHAWISRNKNKVVENLYSRISNLIGLPVTSSGMLQLIYYGTDQQYKPHYDSWDETTEKGKACLKEKGQRVLTCLFYLNDVEEGGGTFFPDINLEVEAKKGRLLIFHNCITDTANRNKKSKHSGMLVTKGYKWASTIWFTDEVKNDKVLNF